MRQKQAGHDRPVWVYNIIARDTVDEMVIDRVTTKRAVSDILTEAMKRRNL
jgi:SNF2 family DNA or RNA helicase